MSNLQIVLVQRVRSGRSFHTKIMSSSIELLGTSAACFNSCMLVVNVFFTRSREIERLNPSLFSVDGQVSVLLWGMAYYAAAERSTQGGELIWLVFAVEKMYYVYRWVQWIRSNNAMALIRKAVKSGNVLDILSPLFHSTYGLGDFFFGVLFFMAWRRAI